MSTPKKKPAARKAKPAKKPAARPIPPPPPGWEIVGKDDPRLKKLPCRPLAYDATKGKWHQSLYGKGADATPVLSITYALPIATQSATPQPQSPTPMIRLRRPSEKPTREDGGVEEFIFVIYKNDELGVKDVAAWRWDQNFYGDELAWFSLPDGILPREPSQEEKWRAEFEAWLQTLEPGYHSLKEEFWTGFLAAKKGGAE